jgi:hypothetical protein
MELDYEKLLKGMLNVSKGILSKYWKDAEPYAKQEFDSFLQNIKMIGALKLTGEISEEQAKLHLNIQKQSIQTVLTAIEGLGIIAVENAINAAIAIIKDSVNRAIGWNIL